MSPPAWWCGLKLQYWKEICVVDIVTTCVVVWIEICSIARMWGYRLVTTCVVVWIEMQKAVHPLGTLSVTTCVVVWIEIISGQEYTLLFPRHHLRGGVD